MTETRFLPGLLRAYPSTPLMKEAADRIEALEAAAIKTLECSDRQEDREIEHLGRISDLEKANSLGAQYETELETRIVGLEAMLVDGSKREQELEDQISTWIKSSTAHCKRIHVLEAALREMEEKIIHKGADQELLLPLIRRALEGKP